MKTLTALLLLSAALTSPLAAHAAEAHHHGASPETHQLQLNAGKKWDTDAALRQAMTAIHGSVTQILDEVHSGKADLVDYDTFGNAINQQVAYVVENCKLPPAADEQLHIIVADLTAGAEAAQGKHGEDKRIEGVVKTAKAANAYGKYFSHSGWTAIPLSH